MQAGRTTATAERSVAGHVTGLLLATAIALAALIAFGAGQARAADDGSLSMSLDTGIINLGTNASTNGVKIIDPSLDPPDPPATLNATLTDGSVSTPPAGFSFPTKSIDDLDAGPLTVDAVIEISAASEISGNFDTTTGASDISIPAEALISVYAADTPHEPSGALGICKVSGFTLSLATNGDPLEDPGDPDTGRDPATYDAADFDLSGDSRGAMTAHWDSLPASTVVGGSLGGTVCPQVDGLIGGPGGIWLEGTATPSTAPVELPPSAAPELTAQPDPETNSTAADFAFEQGDGEEYPVTKFRCRIDGGEWADCTSGEAHYLGLPPGGHAFEVEAGNDIGWGPATTYQWTIGAAPTKAPMITASPPRQTTQTTASFAFYSGDGETQPVTLFQCRLDGGQWSQCDSGFKSYSGLTVGSHSFQVRGGNDVGYGPVATWSWKVAAVNPPPPTCAEDPSQAKCRPPTCAEDPSQAQCRPPTCAEDPSQAKCRPAAKAKFARLKVKPKTRKVKRGKKATFKVRVKNRGDAATKRAKVCLRSPKKKVRPVGGKCKKVKLGAGKSKKVKFKVKVTRKAKAGRKYKLTFKASAKGIGSKKARAKVKVRR